MIQSGFSLPQNDKFDFIALLNTQMYVWIRDTCIVGPSLGIYNHATTETLNWDFWAVMSSFFWTVSQLRVESQAYLL